MNNAELIEFINDNISTLEKFIEHTKNEVIKTYYRGELYAFKLVLEQIKSFQEEGIDFTFNKYDLSSGRVCIIKGKDKDNNYVK